MLPSSICDFVVGSPSLYFLSAYLIRGAYDGFLVLFAFSFGSYFGGKRSPPSSETICLCGFY